LRNKFNIKKKGLTLIFIDGKVSALYLNKTVLMLHSIRVQKYLRVAHISQINNDFYNCKKEQNG
jgi:hypothetical protein